MGRDRDSKHKRSRREGVDLYGTGGESLQRRINQPPGMHGTTQRRTRQSEYGRQLREKQKVKRIYGVRERQFQRFFNMAQRMPDLTGAALLKLLERRLDNVIYRLGYARSRPQARQFVNHGHVLVDGQKVDIPSFLVEPGQSITVRDDMLRIPDVQELGENPPAIPSWLERTGDGGRILDTPEREEIDQDINEQLIVEFYSR